MAAFFANQHDVINLEGLVDFNLESLIDVIPAGVIRDAKDITVGGSFSFLWLGGGMGGVDGSKIGRHRVVEVGVLKVTEG